MNSDFSQPLPAGVAGRQLRYFANLVPCIRLCKKLDARACNRKVSSSILAAVTIKSNTYIIPEEASSFRGYIANELYRLMHRFVFIMEANTNRVGLW